jgi:methylmalonyl-CoA mutase N-terminal domain/subunit
LYRLMKERYGIDDPSCGQLRVHVQSSGSTHTHQEPLNNLVRIAYQVLAGVLGGAQSIHANGYDEAVCLPTEEAMLLAIRTEQIIALETNVTNTVDPLGGSYYIENLTNELEERAWDYVKKIEDVGGMAEAVKSGWLHREYKAAIIDYERKLDAGDVTVVGVNKFRLEKPPYQVPIFRPDPKSPDVLIERIKLLRQKRDSAKTAAALKKYEEVARSDENTVPAIFEAVKAHATPGELAEVQLKVCGNWTYPIAG